MLTTRFFTAVKTRTIKVGLPELIAGIVIWFIVGSVVYFTRGMPFEVEGSPGPRFLPIVIAAFLAILNILYWVEVMVKGGSGVQFPSLKKLARPAGFFCIAILIILLWERLGAVLTILVIGVLELKWLEGHSWMRSFFVSLGMGVFTYVLFQLILEINLPAGLLESLLIK